MIDGSRPGPERVDPVGHAPAEVVRLAVRCERLEAAVARCQAHVVDYSEGRTIALVALGKIGQELLALDAALVAAGATGKAGT